MTNRISQIGAVSACTPYLQDERSAEHEAVEARTRVFSNGLIGYAFERPRAATESQRSPVESGAVQSGRER